MILKNLVFLSIITIALFSACSNDDGVNLPGTYPEDLLGEIDFIKTFGGSRNETLVAAVQTNDGAYVFMGTTDSTDGDITGKRVMMMTIGC